MKTVWSGWLIIAGMGPIAWKAWDTYNTRGNAASNNTGGNAPPEAGPPAVTTPSNAAGAENVKPIA